ncbi:universal stress protein [Paroceanicella profunda]|uniref:Universal stress protein n=1 Tax=Paroceanicella profunda TaxID=2579971 RepID=A0A5B8FGB6_9RHOB|nr:universal stress protein [Paroceanicella profunda]QDL90658.1 universal stress protein [Paroceanicella profunda]
MDKIAAFIDGSAYGESVCDHAAWIAGATGAAVDLVHVLGRREAASTPADLSGNLRLGARSALLEELARHDEARARLARARGHAILEDARTRLAAAGVTAGQEVLRSGDIVETVTEIAGASGLVVIGKRGEGADFAKGHLGSNLERILREATRPVLVASRAFSQVRSVLIAHDGGASAEKAVAFLAANAPFARLACHLLSAGRETPELRARLDAAAARLSAAGAAVTAEIREGEPEQLIAETVASRDIGLLAMGAYGHSRIRSLIIGSTTTEMVRSCKVPVILFR